MTNTPEPDEFGFHLDDEELMDIPLDDDSMVFPSAEGIFVLSLAKDPS